MTLQNKQWIRLNKEGKRRILATENTENTDTTEDTENTEFLFYKEKKRRILATENTENTDTTEDTENTEFLFYKERKRKILATEDTEILFFLQREKEKEVKMEKGLWNENRDWLKNEELCFWEPVQIRLFYFFINPQNPYNPVHPRPIKSLFLKSNLR